MFGILSFVGFEAATTLGEEVKDPKRNVPKGIILSLIFVGAIYLYCTYAEMVGFGREGVTALAGDTALAGMYAPWIKLLIGLAGISSIFAVIMNSNNGVVRIIFAMGREGMLPRQLAHIHPKNQTPSTTIWVQGVVAALFTFGVGAIAGPFNTYAYLVIILLGNQMLNSTLEEKENRVTEMILTTLNATTLIVGKVISLFLVGLVQVLIFVTPVLVAYLFFRDQLALPNLDLSTLQLQPGPMITGALLLFGGFLLFTGTLVAAGAARR